MICVVDYGVCNTGSIVNMFKRAGHVARTVTTAQELAAASKIVLPGVGSFDAGMRNLQRLGIIDALNEQVVTRRTPVLGICLGMQLMARGSEEGSAPGLGWVRASTRRFEPALIGSLKVPHMGWRSVSAAKDSALLAGLDAEPRFYFVHSYFVACDEPSDVLLTSEYGMPFHAGFESRNILGVQFHPEKSHRYGLQLLRNFAERY